MTQATTEVELADYIEDHHPDAVGSRHDAMSGWTELWIEPEDLSEVLLTLQSLTDEKLHQVRANTGNSDRVALRFE